MQKKQCLVAPGLESWLLVFALAIGAEILFALTRKNHLRHFVTPPPSEDNRAEGPPSHLFCYIRARYALRLYRESYQEFC